ncbi:adenylate kinase [Streptomyces fimicarius]|uniref:adenylate kinase n=1 Tax=Streptomyces griseus TaxID=1911 RepID=UPI0036AC2089
MTNAQTGPGASPAHLHRIALFGAPATGKTTLARWLSIQLDMPHTDLDDILFTPQGPLPLEEFRRQAAAITATGGWIVEGNFSKLADVVWHRADTLVWLDLPLPLILYRITRRSLRQLTGRENSAQARRLTWNSAFFARRSLLRTAVRKHRTNRPRYARQVAETAALGIGVVRLRSPRQVRYWRQRTATAPQKSRSRAARRSHNDLKPTDHPGPHRSA